MFRSTLVPVLSFTAMAAFAMAQDSDVPAVIMSIAPATTIPTTPGGARGPPGGSGPPRPQGAGAGPPGERPHSPYIYIPSFSMAIVGIVLFLLSFIVSTIQLFKLKAWFINILPQAILVDVIAAAARVHSTLHLNVMGAFIVQMLAFQIAPALTVIAIMFTFSRLIWWVTPNDKCSSRYFGISPHRVTILWLILYAVCDLTKVVASNLAKPKKGERPNPASIANRVQNVGIILTFLVLSMFFAYVFRFMRMSRAWLIHGEAEARDWRRLGWTVCAAAGLIAARAGYVIIEFDAMYDPKAFVSLHEWVFWVCNAIPMLIVYTLFNFNHPGSYLPREYTRLKFNSKAIERAKLESAAWPMQRTSLSGSAMMRHDDKEIQVIHTSEVHPGNPV